MDKLSVLRKYFGHSDFRAGQETLIDAILSGRDALGIMPTGGGKSVCYQVPALLLPGVTLVISPLISLMKDQVAALTQSGIPAAYINSSLSLADFRRICAEAEAGRYKLLYVAPERLETDGFSALARELRISLVAVDEAHCISQWGQNFRPSYLRIPDFVASLSQRPVVAAFTATATAQVREDILRLLHLQDPARCVTGFDRPNLYFDVQSHKNKMSALLALLRERQDRSGIVYCATRVTCERVCAALCENGIPAVCYHAGMEDGDRAASQDDFQFDRKNVIVATNAFGMGIDKSNVGFVIHYNMPKSLEAYYQEAGRAGRDGEPADCILLFSARDIKTAKFLIDNSGSNELDEAEQARIRRCDHERLQAMIGYCKTGRCLRGAILDYFGQAHPETCGNCGNCRGTYQTRDITTQAQMILSCVYRVRERLGYSVGKALILNTLRGSRSQRVRDLGLDKLSTYGLLKEQSVEQVRAYIEHLESAGYLRTNTEHSTIEPTAAARAVLFSGEKVSLSVRTDRKPGRREKLAATHALPTENTDLFAALKAARTCIAQREGVPAYVVFSNAALVDMAAKRPRTREEFLGVSGVGEVKAARYGEAFLRVIADYEAGVL